MYEDHVKDHGYSSDYLDHRVKSPIRPKTKKEIASDIDEKEQRDEMEKE